MFKFINSLKQKSLIFKILLNKYFVIILFFTTWMLFFDTFSYLRHRELDTEINELNDNKEYFITELNKDSAAIKSLKQSFQQEKYAREKYFMKKDSEDIYIVEFEKDKKRDSILEAEK